MDLTRATDELFSAPWDGFVEARARLAVELAQAGKRDDSRALKKLRRPTAAAWATNQVVRRARPAVEAFLAASDQLRARQAAMLERGGDRAAYQTAAEAFRQATAALSQAARQVLPHAGREADRALVDGVVANVRAAALADERRAELLAGRLLADIVAGEGGLEGLFGGAVAAATAHVARAPVAASRTPPAGAKVLQFDVAAQKAREAEAQARAQREEHARQVAAAKDDEATAVDAAARAAAVAAEARTTREAAEDRVREVEAARAAARQALDEATAAERKATHASSDAATGAARATQRRATLEREAPP